MKLSYIVTALEEFAPRTLQEKWDNSGLLVGLPDGSDECTGAMLCVDVTEEIVNEAVEHGCNLVVSHHPLIFKGLKTLTGRTVSERAVMAAVRKGVAVYSAHTSLDSTLGGVSYAMAERLGTRVVSVLSPAELSMSRISVICPRDKAADVRLLMLDNGCGAPYCGGNSAMSPTAPTVDNSSKCAYADVDGEKLETSAPDDADGCDIVSDMLSHQALTCIEATVPTPIVAAIKGAIKGLPGGDDISVDIATLDNRSDMLGLGVVAVFDKQIKMSELLDKVKERFGVFCVRSSAAYDPEMEVRKIALCGGAGGEFIDAAARSGAQVYVTADVRYHDFADHREGMTIFDIGHFESESCAKDIFYHILTNKFANFAVYYSELENNPVKYL